MSEQIRAGVIGLGILGGEHASFLDVHPSVDLVAVTDLRSHLADELAAKTGAQAFTNYDEMLRSKHLDLVVVATPDPLHRDPTLAAVEAGVPAVIQEKPLATTLQDAEAIYNAVEKKGTNFFINFANRAGAPFKASHYVVQNGLLGRVVYGEVRLDDNISVPTQMWAERSKDWAAGSSTVHFLLSHVVDLVRWIFHPAEVTQVYAISQREVLEYTPDVYDAFLTFDSGLKLRVKAEWIKHIEELVEFYLCFSGVDGTLIHNRRPGFAAQEGWRANLSPNLELEAVMHHQEALSQHLGVDVAAMCLRPDPKASTLSAGGGSQLPALETRVPGDLPMGLGDPIIDAIVEGTREPACWRGIGPLPDHLDGLKQTQVCVAIEQSADKGKTIDVP